RAAWAAPSTCAPSCRWTSRAAVSACPSASTAATSPNTSSCPPRRSSATAGTPTTASSASSSTWRIRSWRPAPTACSCARSSTTPTPTWTALAATAFQSRYDELWFEDAIFVQNDPLLVRLDASQPYALDGDVFASGRLRSDGDIPMGTDIRASHRKSRTSDYSFSLKWLASDRTEISTDLQFIKATTRALDSTVALGLNIPWIDVDLGGGVPRLGVRAEER